MNDRISRAAVAAVVLLACGGASWAAPIATLTFTTPTATVGPTDSIPVYLTLTLDPSSVPLTTDGSGNVTSGLTLTDIQNNEFTNGLPAGYSLPSYLYDFNSDLNEGFDCGSNFVASNSCYSGPPYDFTWNFALGEFGFAQNLDLANGSSTPFLFGTFSPTNGGPVPPGTYSFPQDIYFFIQVYDPNYNEDPGDSTTWLHVADITIADTNSSGSVFTRTVESGATPEPETWALMLGGLASLGGVWRRKRSSR